MHVAASHIRRILATSLASALACAGTAAAAPSALHLTGPSRVVQGAEVEIGAAVRSGTRCTLMVRYRSGIQNAGSAISAGGRATVTFEVPRRAATGRATATMSCAGAGRASKRLMVIGSVIPARIQVVKQGFTHRVLPYGGSTVSWGVVLSNSSPQQDALDVTVLANFVMPDNRLIGSATARANAIGAGGQYAIGGELSFIGVPPIARLEIVAQIGRREPAQRGRPGISFARVVPEPYDAGYVGTVEGEIQNDNPRRTLESAQLATVVLDAEGNVLGGGTGYAFASLPPGARQFFKISSSFRAIPIARATAALVSVTPQYRQG